MQKPDIDAPDLSLSALFEHWPEAAPLFFKHNMACPGCPVARFYALSDACRRAGLDETQFRAEIKTRVQAARKINDR